MKKSILYLHGFASSGASGTVELLRRAFWHPERGEEIAIIAPDIPVDPNIAVPFIREVCTSEQLSLIVGTSMGAMYAQQLHGATRVCVNPSFSLSKKYDILFVGKHKWLNRRQDGETEFQVTKEIVEHFVEMESHQFDDCTPLDAALCHGLFGDEDTIGLPHRDTFELYYPGMSRLFHGGHRMNADVVNHVLIPYIREKGLI